MSLPLFSEGQGIGGRTSLEGFEAFWDAYPRKVGRLAAVKVWQRLHPDLTAVLDALQWQRQTTQWQDLTYVPHPKTWLSQGRWLDEAPVRKRLDGRTDSEPCPVCGYPDPRYHSQVECNRMWLEQQKAQQA